MRAALLLLAAAAAAAACGDNLAVEDVVTPTGGSRLYLQWYGYADGTRQPAADEFFDRREHTRCTPRRWADGVVRCVPVADDAVFTDGKCRFVVGRALTIEEPTHFIGYDVLAGERQPARIYAAGDETTPITRFYQRVDGRCVGPFAASPDVVYHEILYGFAGAELVPIRDREAGEGRVALQLHASDDGMQVPFGLRDRTLDVACTPVARPDGSVACEPAGAVAATHFRDPACEAPVVVVPAGFDEDPPPPAIAQVTGADACPRYHTVGPAITTTLYRRDGDTCRPATIVPTPTIYEVGAPLELPAFTRSLEALPGRRLQRVVLEAGDLRFFDDVLHDTAMRTDCRRGVLGDGDATRCLPAEPAAASRLFTPTCVIAVDVVEQPARTCGRPRFATSTDFEGQHVHAIGDPVAGSLHFWDAGSQCRVYTPAAGATLLRLGPAIDPTAFMGAVYFGER